MGELFGVFVGSHTVWEPRVRAKVEGYIAAARLEISPGFC